MVFKNVLACFLFSFITEEMALPRFAQWGDIRISVVTEGTTGAEVVRQRREGSQYGVHESAWTARPRWRVSGKFCVICFRVGLPEGEGGLLFIH